MAKKANLAKVSTIDFQETENQAIEAIEGVVGQSSDQNIQKDVGDIHKTKIANNVADLFTLDDCKFLKNSVLDNQPITFIKKFMDIRYQFDFIAIEGFFIWFSFCSNAVDSNQIKFEKGKFLETNYNDLKSIIFDSLQITEIEKFKPINQISVEGEPEGVSEVFINACNKISIMSAEINDKFVLICVYLHDLKAHYCRNFVLYGCKNIYDFAELRFGFGRTTTKNMISIYEKFIAQAHLKAEFVNYSFSQLVELASVDKSLLSNFNAKMTVKDIRAKKKELVGNNASVGNDNCGLIKQAEEILQPTVGEFISLIREKINADVKNPYQCTSSSGKAFDKGLSAVFDVLFNFDLPVTLETFFKMRCEDKLETVAEVE